MLPLPSFLETFTTGFSGTQPASRHSPWLLHAPALAPNPSANLLTSFFQFRRKHDPKWTSKSARYPYNTWKESEYADTHLQLMGDDKTLKKRKEGNNEEQWELNKCKARGGIAVVDKTGLAFLPFPNRSLERAMDPETVSSMSRSEGWKDTMRSVPCSGVVDIACT